MCVLRTQCQIRFNKMQSLRANFRTNFAAKLSVSNPVAVPRVDGIAFLIASVFTNYSDGFHLGI